MLTPTDNESERSLPVAIRPSSRKTKICAQLKLKCLLGNLSVLRCAKVGYFAVVVSVVAWVSIAEFGQFVLLTLYIYEFKILVTSVWQWNIFSVLHWFEKWCRTLFRLLSFQSKLYINYARSFSFIYDITFIQKHNRYLGK